jgi:hypothetical protein
MKKIAIVKLIIAVMVLVTIVFSVSIIKVLGENNLSKDNAEKRALEFAEAVNYGYKDPEKIYVFLSSDFKDNMSEEDFIEAFEKERSYPYLTPLYINFSSVELSEDMTEGAAIYSQAARLPGMIYQVKLVFENNNYYVYAFEDFLDGSYLEKFNTLSYSLDSYFDFKK